MIKEEVAHQIHKIIIFTTIRQENRKDKSKNLFRIRYSSYTIMRNYIFTESEKDTLYEWLKGRLQKKKESKPK